METTNTKKIPLIKQSTSYKIIIPEKVERLIRFLCEKIWNTEWSGVLFYTPTGKFEDGSLEIHCVDIFPMDVGSTTYTEFDMSPDVISYMTQNPELLDCKMGLIHSHNNMATFFSGTDTDTLQEEGAERNHFVSLIVNNEGSYTAAITRKIKYISTRELSYEGFDGTVELPEKDTTEGEEIEYFNLNIVFENNPKDEFSEVASRIAEIKAAKTTKSYWGDYNSQTSGDSTKTSLSYPGLWDDAYNYYEEAKKEPYEYPWNKPAISKPESKKSVIITNKAATSLDKAVNDELITGIVNQLITGSVTVTKLDEDSKKKLVNSITRRFDKRFGAEDSNHTLFKNWAVDFIEYLLWYSVDDPSLDECEVTCEIARKTIDALKKLPDNEYIEDYINLFTSYVDRI